MARIWKALQALLQYCCMSEYQQISETLVEEKNAEVQAIIDEYTGKLEKFMEENTKMIDDLKQKELKFNALEGEKENAIRDKLRAERQVVSH